jgi:hypothetical protein
MLGRFFADVKGDRKQAVQATLLSNGSLVDAVHPTVRLRRAPKLQVSLLA